MGYLTTYSFEARKLTEEDRAKLKKTLAEIEYPRFEMYNWDNDGDALYAETGEITWHNHTLDMCLFSAEFPTVPMRLHGEGDDRGDVWDEYYLCGQLVDRLEWELVAPPPPPVVGWED